MTLQTTVVLVAGLVMLVAGAELLVRGASHLASRVGVSSLVIGLTIVAYGTSSPELAVSTSAALRDGADIALGNVVGSNIFNVALILGLSALVTPLVIAQQLIRIDVPLMIGVSVVAWAMARDGWVGRAEGGLLVLGAIVYTVFAIVASRRESAQVRQEYEEEFGTSRAGPSSAVAVDVVLIVTGLVMLVVGSGWLIDGAIAVARHFAISELIISLTLVATGTSLPELATSIVAAVRGERDIAVGNVVGSNIFNILAVLGVSAFVSPRGIAVSDEALRFDLPVMIVIAIVCMPVFFTGRRISRLEGLLLLVLYGLYTAALVARATGGRFLGVIPLS